MFIWLFTLCFFKYLTLNRNVIFAYFSQSTHYITTNIFIKIWLASILTNAGLRVELMSRNTEEQTDTVHHFRIENTYKKTKTGPFSTIYLRWTCQDRMICRAGSTNFGNFGSPRRLYYTSWIDNRMGLADIWNPIVCIMIQTYSVMN